MAHREKFVPALRDLGIAADQARVSRWESGSQRVPDRVVVAYEQVLGLAPGHLCAAVKGLRRSLEPDSEKQDPAATPPVELHEELDRLFEQVDGDAPHGSYWLELADYLATHPQIYLRPKSWTQLADSLIGEMGRATGAAYSRRFEALRTLVRHPGAQRHVVKSIGAFVTDPAAQVVMHPLTLLQEVEHPQAGELAVRLLTTSTGMLQQGAAWVTAAKICRGHFDETYLRQLEAVTVRLLTSGERSVAEVDLLDVAARLPEDATRRVAYGLRDTPVLPRFELMLRTGEILPSDVTRQVAKRIAESAQGTTPAPYQIEPDTMLQRLVREALFHGHQERRHQASVLLNVSPYRAGVAAALVPTIDNSDESVALPAVMLLRYLAAEAERNTLLRWAEDGDRPRIRGHALVTLGRLPDGVRPEEEPLVVRHLVEDSRRPTQRAALYALGMGGSPALTKFESHDDEFVRRAAEWWSRTGPAIHEPREADM